MSYDPRTATGIPTEPVGSLPRPAKLQAAYAAYDAGTIKFEQLVREQDDACRDAIKRFEATGSPIISDGEQRISSFATYPLADTLAGTGLAGTDTHQAGPGLRPRQLGRRPGGSATARAVQRLRAADGPHLVLPHSRQRLPLRSRRRGQAAGDRPVHRGTGAGQEAVRARAAARLRRPAGPPGTSPLLILASSGFRAGPARLIVERVRQSAWRIREVDDEAIQRSNRDDRRGS